MREQMLRVLTTQITAEHKVEDKESILVVLESVAKVDEEWVVDLESVSKWKSCEERTSSKSLLS